MKENYVAHVLEEYIADGNFDAVFGDEWIDGDQLDALIPVVCDSAFAGYGIDAKGKYKDEVGSIFEALIASQAIVRHGDEYSGMWFKLRPPYKKKYMDELRAKNPATKRIDVLGEEALRRALNKIVAEDGLRSADEQEQGNIPSDPESALPRSPNPDFFKSEARKEEFVSLATDTLKEVEDSDLSNSEKSQARGFLIAAKALSETPDPPVDLIWSILNRANSLAGIGSFFVGLIMLIAMVA